MVDLMREKGDIKNDIPIIKCKWGKGKCHFCGFEGLVAIVLECPPDLCTCGEPVEAICWKCLRKMNPIFDKEPISIEKEELKLDQVNGKCELCGFEGKVIRCSKPIEGYKIYKKDGALVFTERKVQQICDRCLAESFAKKIEDLLESPNDPQVKDALKQLELVLKKHGIKLTHKS
jgi:hypothetical protein